MQTKHLFLINYKIQLIHKKKYLFSINENVYRPICVCFNTCPYCNYFDKVDESGSSIFGLVWLLSSIEYQLSWFI